MGREVKRVQPGAPFGDHLPDCFEPEAGEWWQMFQTVSDKPYTPAFATPEELADHLASEQNAWASNDRGMTRDRWLKFITGPGCSPSFVADERGFRSGVEAATE